MTIGIHNINNTIRELKHIKIRLKFNSLVFKTFWHSKYHQHNLPTGNYLLAILAILYLMRKQTYGVSVYDSNKHFTIAQL